MLTNSGSDAVGVLDLYMPSFRRQATSIFVTFQNQGLSIFPESRFNPLIDHEFPDLAGPRVV